MAKEYAKAFYNSDAWKNTRKAYYQLRRGRCEKCLKEIEEGVRSPADEQPGTIVHHKIHITPKNINDPKITLSYKNLELDCDEHHNREHHSKPKRVRYDKQGNIIPF